MYLGKIVEIVLRKNFMQTRFTHTQGSDLRDTGSGSSAERKRIVIPGEVPSPIDPPPAGHRVNAANCQASVDAPLGLKEVVMVIGF